MGSQRLAQAGAVGPADRASPDRPDRHPQARVYSSIRPLRTDLRRIRSVSRPVTVALGALQFVGHALRYAQCGRAAL
jgi:hypothetical protein